MTSHAQQAAIAAMDREARRIVQLWKDAGVTKEVAVERIANFGAGIQALADNPREPRA